MIGFHFDRTRELTGKVVCGVEKASFFTQLAWVQEQCLEKLGFEPYPGTLNLELLKESHRLIKELQGEEGIKLIPPDPEFCAATVFSVSLGSSVKGAIIVPSEEVNVHGKNIVEILAGIRLRDALGVVDGDLVTLAIDGFV